MCVCVCVCKVFHITQATIHKTALFDLQKTPKNAICNENTKSLRIEKYNCLL